MESRSVQFQLGSAELAGSARQLLRQVADELVGCPQAYVNVVGHTDSIGTIENNLRLSQNRAASVQDYLIERGIEPRRLTSEGRGESEPIASNLDERGRILNRRIEFQILSEPTP